MKNTFGFEVVYDITIIFIGQFGCLKLAINYTLLLLFTVCKWHGNGRHYENFQNIKNCLCHMFCVIFLHILWNFQLANSICWRVDEFSGFFQIFFGWNWNFPCFQNFKVEYFDNKKIFFDSVKRVWFVVPNTLKKLWVFITYL